MIAPSLQARLEEVFRRQRQLRLALSFALCWAALAVSGLVLFLLRPSGASLSPLWIVALILIGAAAGAVVFLRDRRAQPDWHDLARRVERQYPELNGLLLTAAQQQPAPDGQLHYLQRRIVSEAVNHSQSHSWGVAIPEPRIVAAKAAHLVAFLLFLTALVSLQSPGKPKSVFADGWTADGVTITPGDTSIERGERLVIVASFAGSVPAKVELVTTGPAALIKRTPLVKSLSDPLFGGSVSEVVMDFVYRVEYASQRTRDFTVKVFEFPRLERADADLTFPDYTGLAPKRVENTRRISAVEGTRCTLTLQLNKPVVRAQLVPKGETGIPLPLVVATNSPTVTLTALTLETNSTYLLQLVDADGRTNKLPAQFVLDALKNREPELKIASPRGDTRPSALEEVSFEGTVWDDFGVQAYGLAYIVGGGETRFVELGRAAPANEKRSFKHLLRLEDLGAQPDQLISWFLWADDIGPDGQLRRSAGDMYFAEVRPFDEVFRQGQGGGGSEQPEAGGESGGSGSPQTKLAELQKQIINATWKLQRQQTRQPPAPPPAKSRQRASPTSQTDPTRRTFGVVARTTFGQPAPGSAPATQLGRSRERLSRLTATNQTASASQFVEDLNVVRDAVTEAIEQAEAAREQMSGARNAALWEDVIRELQKAQAALEKAAQSPPSLADALAAEQSAFQVLLRLQQREYEVTRNRSRSQSSGNSRNQQMQRQLHQLDLTQPENRYENERLAQSPQSPERREQLQVMNRLGELARRQQDLNERLKELQTALQEAKTEPEREEIRRQLKRLQEEEQRMLADVDELQQRMNQPENQSRMSEQRQQLDQTRQEMERTAEAAQQGAASQALASGTRAQRQLQEMREQMRKQNSGEFADELKQLRAEAREAERQQQKLQKQVENLSGSGPKTLDDSHARQQTLDQLAQQAQRLTNLVQRATELSQQTEDAEPLASRELYEALRKFSQDNANSIRRAQDELIERGLLRTELYQRLTQLEKADGVKSVELTSEMLRQGLLPQAQQAGNRVGSAVSDLKRGIERAAEKVLGDDTEALRLAQQQLDQLTKQIESEIAQSQGAGETNGPAQASNAQSQPAQRENAPGGAGQRNTNAQPATAGSQGQAQASSPGERAVGPTRPISPRNPDQPQAGSASEPDTAQQPDAQAERGAASAQNRNGQRGSRSTLPQRGSGTPGPVPAELEQFLNTSRGGGWNGGVITGEDFVPWTDRLREVEEIVEDPALQNQLATARDRARVMRQEYKRTREEPEWTRVRSQVVKPLVEVRNQIADELIRRGPRENLVPIDRDPVPNRYSESVRRYYEELGKDK